MDSKTLGSLIIIAFSLALFCVKGVFSHATEDTVRFTLESKERIVKSDSSYYLIFTNNGVYKNKDDFWQMKFNSSDLYQSLKENEMYECKKNFWRVPFLSWYPNLIECQHID